MIQELLFEIIKGVSNIDYFYGEFLALGFMVYSLIGVWFILSFLMKVITGRGE
jgi:hypothetical protein